MNDGSIYSYPVYLVVSSMMVRESDSFSPFPRAILIFFGIFSVFKLKIKRGMDAAHRSFFVRNAGRNPFGEDSVRNFCPEWKKCLQKLVCLYGEEGSK